MPRKSRGDQPDTWHHVVNRGIARRTLFEEVGDFRYFLSRLARSVRRGEIEVHAYTLLTTHFHLLVRSPSGQLAEALRRVQNDYSRRFNRLRRRDGPLFRGRFTSKRIEELDYRATVVRYIDDNARAAGLAGHPCEYPFCSAFHYARRTGPAWLSRGWVEAWTAWRARAPSFRSEDYVSIAGAALPESDRDWLEARVRHRASVERPSDALGALRERTGPQVLDWMRRKAELADGTHPGLPLADVREVEDHLAALDASGVPELEWANGRSLDALPILRAALLREACGLSFRSIAVHLGCSPAQAHSNYQHHRHLLNHPTYAEWVRCQVNLFGLLPGVGAQRLPRGEDGKS